MFGQFDPEKAAEAAAGPLKTTPPGRMSYLRLLKLLYLADRESIRETGHPITGDHVAALRNGPVLSRVYDCIKNQDPEASVWQRVCRKSGDWDVELAQDPGLSKLSRCEAELLERVAGEHRDKDDWELVEYTHQLPEWLKNEPEWHTSRPISPRDILEAVGLGDEADDVLTEAEYHIHMAQQFARAEAEIVEAQ